MKISFQEAPIRRFVADMFVLTRMPSVVAGGVEALLGSYLATGHALVGRSATVLAAISMALAVAAAMVFNDFIDMPVDAITKPNRPLPSGRRTPRFAAALSLGCAVGALACALPLGIALTAATVGLLAVSAIYSTRLKSTVLVGNVAVAVSASVPVAFGAAACGVVTSKVMVAFFLIFTFMFSYEIVKTIADREGDAAGGVRTVTTALGVDVSVRMLAALGAALTVGAVAATVGSSHRLLYIGLATIFIALALYAIRLLRVDVRPSAVKRSVTAMRLAWVTGSLTLWFLR
jgi:geranylgeranylglycerol-phosphate geranylgeranyltransferase